MENDDISMHSEKSTYIDEHGYYCNRSVLAMGDRACPENVHSTLLHGFLDSERRRKVWEKQLL